MISQFPGKDLLDVAFEAWKLMGDLLSDSVVEFGGQPLDLSMPCRHDPESVRLKRYSQREFFMNVDGVDLAEQKRQWNEERLKRSSSQ